MQKLTFHLNEQWNKYTFFTERLKKFSKTFFEKLELWFFFLAQEMSVKMAGSLNVVYGAGLKVD